MKLRVLEKANKLLYFTKDQLMTLSADETKKSVEQSIFRWLKKGELVRLKRGVYTTKKIVEKHSNNFKFREFIATRLKEPAYLSLEYVLFKYNVISEANYAMTLVTLKTGSRWRNDLGAFLYKNIKRELFTGYKLELFEKNEYLKATKSKALFDFLYFKAGSLANNINKRNFVEELRLNLDSFSKKDLMELRSYGKLAKIKK